MLNCTVERPGIGKECLFSRFMVICVKVSSMLAEYRKQGVTA